MTELVVLDVDPRVSLLEMFAHLHDVIVRGTERLIVIARETFPNIDRWGERLREIVEQLGNDVVKLPRLRWSSSHAAIVKRRREVARAPKSLMSRTTISSPRTCRRRRRRHASASLATLGRNHPMNRMEA